ncbi:hypothetical protein CRG98_031881 [Punica granatum]|uniref:Uncharacterized protein n=1 Tax=Punica granatum TaxID=22663 RepID=A0A2I0IUT9_PUNGR|nr:hypothetical protein CRG98_031881 [Punica granatum]
MTQTKHRESSQFMKNPDSDVVTAFYGAERVGGVGEEEDDLLARLTPALQDSFTMEIGLIDIKGVSESTRQPRELKQHPRSSFRYFRRGNFVESPSPERGRGTDVDSELLQRAVQETPTR